MLPVSGALQLKASEAMMCPPIASHRCAYSRLLRPAPRTSSSCVTSCCNGSELAFGASQRAPGQRRRHACITNTQSDERVHVASASSARNTIQSSEEQLLGFVRSIRDTLQGTIVLASTQICLEAYDALRASIAPEGAAWRRAPPASTGSRVPPHVPAPSAPPPAGGSTTCSGARLSGFRAKQCAAPFRISTSCAEESVQSQVSIPAATKII